MKLFELTAHIQLDSGSRKPANVSLWMEAIEQAKTKFDVYPSAFANTWTERQYKKLGGTWTEDTCSHGRYYCSTDKKWKCRQGPKQSRS